MRSGVCRTWWFLFLCSEYNSSKVVIYVKLFRIPKKKCVFGSGVKKTAKKTPQNGPDVQGNMTCIWKLEVVLKIINFIYTSKIYTCICEVTVSFLFCWKPRCSFPWSLSSLLSSQSAYSFCYPVLDNSCSKEKWAPVLGITRMAESPAHESSYWPVD